MQGQRVIRCLVAGVNRGLIGVFALFWVACAGNPVTETTPGEPPYLTVFLVDGFVRDTMQREIQRGNLPNIETLLREGALVDHGIASFPSMTGYGFYPFITGEDAAVSGILGLRFLDRDRASGAFRNYVGRTYTRMIEDLNEKPHTIFEAAGTQATYSFNSYMNRGVSDREMAGVRFSFAKFREAWWLGRLLASLPGNLMPSFASAEGAMVDAALKNLLEKKPKVQWLTFTAPDGYAHVHGLNKEYVTRLHEVDALIGRYREAAKAAGLDSDRVYAVLTDHGLTQVDTNLDIMTALKERLDLEIFRGKATEVWSSALDWPASTFADKDGAIAINGNASAHLYFRRGDVEFHQPFFVDELRAFVSPVRGGEPVDVIESLRKLHGVELVIARADASTVIIMDDVSEGVLTRDGARYAYEAKGADPLHYLESPEASALMDGHPHTADEWLAATLGTGFPDAIYRLGVLFAQADTGDIVLTSRLGYDLVDDYEMVVGSYRGGHGGLRDDQMRVSYILSGKGVRPRAYIKSARAEDIGATLRALTQLPVEPDTGGHVLTQAIDIP